MKFDLDLKLIKSLTLDNVPDGYDSKGKLTFKANPKTDKNGQPNVDFVSSYILGDSNRAAPPGFGVRVAGKKTYIIRRKVRGKSIMPTVGNFADFNRIEDARKKAADLALKMVETGKNPNELARKLFASELTLGQALADYREHLEKRAQRPATKETLRAYDRAVKKHVAWGWTSRKVQDLTTKEIEKKFLEGKAFPTANEQAFRWPMTAVRWCIDFETLAASAERRVPTLVANPFNVLTLNKQQAFPHQRTNRTRARRPQQAQPASTVNDPWTISRGGVEQEEHQRQLHRGPLFDADAALGLPKSRARQDAMGRAFEAAWHGGGRGLEGHQSRMLERQ